MMWRAISSLTGSADDGNYNPNYGPSLMDHYDYVMHGRVFLIKHIENQLVEVQASFGGLLFRLRGDQNIVAAFVMDMSLFILMRKVRMKEGHSSTTIELDCSHINTTIPWNEPSFETAKMRIIHRDERRIFKIESFGFLGGGKINLKVSDFTFHTGKVRHNSTSPHNNLDWEIDQRRHLEKLPYKVGFILRHAESESLAQQDLEYLIERNECIFDKKDEKDIIFDLSNTDLWKGSGLEEIVRKDQMGMYSLIFAQCVPVTTPAYVSFQLDASFTNPGPNYLSAGDKPLPLIYFIYFFIFLGMQAAEVDGKAQANLVKLTQFRQFYMLTLMYIYFTRIAVYLLEATVPFYLLWLGPFCAEGAAAIFYLLTGYSFRPSTDNPYLPVRTEEGEGQEYGLDGDSDDERGLELPKRGV
eukprot:scaffold11024_cov179-Ochromonas_danica.AAC.2